MVSIVLHNLIMYGFHGIHEEERKILGTFEVNLDVKYDDNQRKFDQLEDTISYVDLFEIVKQKIELPGFLLEKICQGIIHKIKDQFPFVKEVTVSIYKLQAPIEHFQGKVGVAMQQRFDD
jgi:7,8-dihydroneopterin aldolase/epimerase/oxygenase